MAEVENELDFIEPASFRGAFWFAERATTSGGRKTVRHSFVKSDRQLIEDLGLNPDDFSISGFVAPIPKGVGRGGAKTYPEAKAALLKALRSPDGPTALIHPFTGRLENIAVLDWRLDESFKNVGRSAITINFALSDSDGVPRETRSVINNVEAGTETVLAAVDLDVKTRFFKGVERLADGGLKQVGRFTQTFEDSVAKVGDFVDFVNDATDPLTKLADEINGFANELETLSRDVFSLVDNPAKLSASMQSVFRSMNDLFDTPEAALTAFSNLFTFGVGDVSSAAPTAAAAQRQQNRDVVNGAVLASALSFAYLNASLIEFESTDEIDLVAEELETQFQSVLAGGALDLATENSLGSLRNVTKTFFDDAKLTAPDVVDFQTVQIPARVLSFQHYGTSALGDIIVGLNKLRDPANVPAGVVKILSQ